MSLTTNLPRLLYVGDVPVASTVAGAALLYRLLQGYPASQLHIVEGNLWIEALESKPETRLPKVAYETLKVGSMRLLKSRFSSVYSNLLHLSAGRKAHLLDRIVDEFQPEAILTVGHGFSWLTAAKLAERFGLPLHFSVHDDWPRYNNLSKLMQSRIDSDFGAVYRQAQSRLCVSPFMEEDYRKRYGVAGHVVYVSRAENSPEFDDIPDRCKSKDSPLVCAFAGSINSGAYARSLATLAEVLQTIDGKLLIYSSLTQESIRNNRLDTANITVRSLIPFKELISELRHEADVLFVPMSFEKWDRANMEIAFPSKLADYTATGLPLLIFGPFYCSAVCWARDNPGVAEIVDQQDASALNNAIGKLADAKYRGVLGQKSLEIGRQFFSHPAVTQQFYQVLCDGEAKTSLLKREVVKP